MKIVSIRLKDEEYEMLEKLTKMLSEAMHLKLNRSDTIRYFIISGYESWIESNKSDSTSK